MIQERRKNFQSKRNNTKGLIEEVLILSIEIAYAVALVNARVNGIQAYINYIIPEPIEAKGIHKGCETKLLMMKN